MCNWTRALRISFVVVITGGADLAAQTVSEYRAHVDSLAAEWRRLEAAQAATRAAQLQQLPPVSARLGPIIVRSDSDYAQLAHDAASDIAAPAQAAYGRFFTRLSRHPFVILRTGNGRDAGVATAMLDSLGHLQLRSADNPDRHWLVLSWSRKVEEAITDEAGPGVRQFAGGTIPIDAPTRDTWSDARGELLVADASVARECVGGRVARCAEMLGVDPVDDPAFANYTAPQRQRFIRENASTLRPIDPGLYDRCTVADTAVACDSVARLIPAEAVPLPAPPKVRLSFVRFALAQGGAGAFDRFVAPGTNRARVEAAARVPADSVIARWRRTVLDARHRSTTLDAATAVSALAWAAACACLALRSSRWR